MKWESAELPMNDSRSTLQLDQWNQQLLSWRAPELGRSFCLSKIISLIKSHYGPVLSRLTQLTDRTWRLCAKRNCLTERDLPAERKFRVDRSVDNVELNVQGCKSFLWDIILQNIFSYWRFHTTSGSSSASKRSASGVQVSLRSLANFLTIATARSFLWRAYFKTIGPGSLQFAWSPMILVSTWFFTAASSNVTLMECQLMVWAPFDRSSPLAGSKWPFLTEISIARTTQNLSHAKLLEYRWSVTCQSHLPSWDPKWKSHDHLRSLWTGATQFLAIEILTASSWGRRTCYRAP